METTDTQQTAAATSTSTSNVVLVHLILTGASGYLGQHLLSQWITKGLDLNLNTDFNTHETRIKITALYNRSEGFPAAVRDFCGANCSAKDNTTSTSASSGDNNNEGVNVGISDVTVRSIDLTDREDIESFVTSSLLVATATATPIHTVNVVVHAAALSSPRLCQEDPDRAKAINVPTNFFDAVLATATAASSLSSSRWNTSTTTAIIALSTDQVYDGKQEANSSYYSETESKRKGLKPVNVYGQTKLEMEDYLMQKQQQHPDGEDESSTSTSSSTSNVLCFALRSSIILGPEAPIDPSCAHGTFLDFVKSRGCCECRSERQQEPTTFFTNEYRSVVRVDRVLETVRGIIANKVLALPATESDQNEATPIAARTCICTIYNMGGPHRVNRMDMARAVFDRFGYDQKLLLATKQTLPQSPLDISMDSSLLFQHGILTIGDGHDHDHDHDDSPNNANANDENEKRQGAKENYLKELVEYVFPLP